MIDGLVSSQYNWNNFIHSFISLKSPKTHLPFIVNHLTLIHFVTISHNIPLLYRSFWIIICWIDFWQVTKVMENGLTIHSIPLFDSLTCSMLETSLVFQIHHDSMVNQLYKPLSLQCLWLMTTNILLYYLDISWNTYSKQILLKPLSSTGNHIISASYGDKNIRNKMRGEREGEE